jgi:uncharacterized protein YoxC
MDLAWWRDLVIVGLGLITTAAIAFISIIIFLVYKRLKTLMNSAKEVVDKVKKCVLIFRRP